MSNTKNIQHLSLYHFYSCPFCAMTRNAIEHLNLEVELRDIQKDRSHRNTLLQQGGKTQVPCLRIEYQDGQTDWLYESRDIINYLSKVAREPKHAA